jgi:hypothetical protein
MNNQEIFGKIVNHLRKQNQKCMDDEGQCLYRNNKGLKCAAGILIDDDEYVPDMELKLFKDLIGKFKLKYNYIGEQISLINYLQMIHDETSIDRWERGFKNCAAQYKLKYAPPAA